MDTGDQLAHAEWLGQVVVGAQLQSCNLIGVSVADREYDDRNLRPLTYLAADLQTVDVGQRQVEQDDIWPPLGDALHAVSPRRGPLDDEAGTSKPGAHRASDLDLIVDHQHPRAMSMPNGAMSVRRRPR